MRSGPVDGRLELVFGRRGAQTTLTHAYARAPLKIVRPFPLDGGRQLVQIITLGPGVCAGDTYAIDVTVEPGASAVVITQSASRLHHMPDGGRGTQAVTLKVAAGGHLEYYPGVTIPFPAADFAQTIDVSIEAGARFGLLECWAMGRIGRDEYLKFRSLTSHTEVRVDRLPVYADTLWLDTRVVNLAGEGLLERHRYLASGYWYGADVDPARGNGDGVLSALGQSAPGHAYFRALAMDGEALGHAMRATVKQVYRSWNLETAPVPRFAS
jgi:urease accessory protein